jgi:hypothetical protein
MGIGAQNKTHAVMAQRIEAKDSPDDFPTPPWATRALIEHILDNRQSLLNKVCLEPACGAALLAHRLDHLARRCRSGAAW